MQSQSEIREYVTHRIVAALQSGVVPFWRRSWTKSKNSGPPSNVVSGKPYQGINRVLLSLMGRDSKWWATYNQWKSLGGQVRRGEKSTTGILYKPVTKTSVNEFGAEETSSYGLLRTFSLFHISQINGDLDQYRDTQAPNAEPNFVDYGPAEEVFAATRADLRIGGDRAFYSPSGDFIQLPPKTSFGHAHEYYSVQAHETVHWTGHERRLNRLNKFARFGSELYAVEELVAELGSAYLLSELGLPQSDDLSNTVSYLDHWIRVLKQNHSAIFSVSAAASASVDHILSYGRSNEEQEIEFEVVQA